MKQPNAILIHGNGGGTGEGLWFPWVKAQLEKLGVPTIAETMPDNVLAPEAKWLPFIRDELAADEHSIIVGHSSGAVAAMRFAETDKILGSILIGACYTDLGSKTEKLSGYYNRPWQWEKIKANQEWIVQFASTDDPWIPVREARYIHKQLDTEYHEYTDKGHFGGDYEKNDFPEIIEIIGSKLRLD
ncbi:MAG: alpha/beta hydrolase [Candidatus Saccharimonadales bacterium]